MQNDGVIYNRIEIKVCSGVVFIGGNVTHDVWKQQFVVEIAFVFVAVMQPPSSAPVDLNTYRARKYAAVQGRGNRTGLLTYSVEQI